jgi:hypothetical protein
VIKFILNKCLITMFSCCTMCSVRLHALVLLRPRMYLHQQIVGKLQDQPWKVSSQEDEYGGISIKFQLSLQSHTLGQNFIKSPKKILRCCPACVSVCINAGMSDCPASDQSGTRLEKNWQHLSFQPSFHPVNSRWTVPLSGTFLGVDRRP